MVEASDRCDLTWVVAAQRTGLALVVSAALVAVCYFLVDRPVALYVHDHALSGFREARWLTEPPPVVQLWSPLVLAALVVRRSFGTWRRWQAVLFTACISLIVADQVRESLGDLFGRYWPETWHDNNPSLIGTGEYGFHPLIADGDAGSFPSGHAARIVAFFGVFWAAMPRGRALYVLLATPMLIALVLMNYHFVSDVIAGGVLGGIVGGYGCLTLNAVSPNRRD